MVVPSQRTAYTPREMRQMMISEFGEWLRTQTNKQHRPLQEETITSVASGTGRWLKAPRSPMGLADLWRDLEAMLPAVAEDFLLVCEAFGVPR
jgi:hypothetical protein